MELKSIMDRARMSVLGVPDAVRPKNNQQIFRSIFHAVTSIWNYLELLRSQWFAAPVRFAALQGVGIELLEAGLAEHRVSLAQFGQGFRG